VSVSTESATEMNVGDMARVCSGELVAGRAERTAVGISIDSRSIDAGNVFVALDGEQYDGHDFADTASAAGASVLVVARDKLDRVGEPSRSRSAVVAVSNTLHALHALARAHRRQFTIPLLAVTGSCGKTTVKEMIAAVVSGKLDVAKTRGNFNNEIGVPLSLFELGPETEFCVIEMGINTPGELTRLCEIGEPTAGLITNIGRAHLEGFGSVENVAAAKAELAEYVAGRGTLFISADDPWCRAIAETFPGECVTFGENEGARVRCVHIETGETTRFTLADESDPYVVAIPGRYSVRNALAAVAVGRWLGVPREHIQTGLTGFERLPMRMAVQRIGFATVIDDTYNANPDSVCAAIDMLVERPAVGDRIAVLGDMKELGDAAAELHRLVGAHAARAGVDLLVAVGEFATEVVHGARDAGMTGGEQCRSFDDRQTAAEFVVRYVDGPNVILVKGSRAARMEEIVNSLSQARAGNGEVRC